MTSPAAHSAPDRRKKAAAPGAGRQRAEFYERPLSSPPLPGEAAAVDSDHLAREFLQAWLWPSGRRSCPRCKDNVVYDLYDGRLRCGGCRYTFTEFNGRWINTGNITASDWLFLARLFVEGLNAFQASEIVGLSYNAVFKAYTAMRFAILARGIDAPQMFGLETGLSQYIKNKRIRFLPRNAQIDTAPVFGIIERGGWVFTDIIDGYQYETLLHLNLSFHLPLGKAGNIVYTSRFRQYQTLLSCTDKVTAFTLAHLANQPEVDTDPQSFWRYALDRLKNFKGITSARFPLYLKEIEFRYNYAGRGLMPLLLERLCDPVPDMAPEPPARPMF